MGARCLAWGLVAIAACADAGKPSDVTPGDAPDTSGPDASATAHACAAGEFAVSIDAAGQVTCAAVGAPTTAAIGASCSAYLGWRDSCDGCTTPPAKYGNAGASCSVGVGGDNTCTTQNLNGSLVPLFGLNTDGDVDGNDKLYGSLHCAMPATSTKSAPCLPGEYISGKSGTNWSCSPLSVAVVDYVRTSCSLYLGWQDGCDGCTNFPTKWGHAGDTTCENGAGADNTCSFETLGTETVNLFGLSPDGDVDNNDKIHVGLHCNAPAPAMATATTLCPPDQFVSGTGTDPSFTCTSPAPLFHAYFTQHCSIYFGWRDGCDGCTLPPAKWGLVKVGGCTLGTGADDTCSKFMMGPVVDMFGMNPDGDVDGNDTLYAALHCE